MTPDFLQGWYHMGVINVWKEKYEEALPHLDKAIELNDAYYLAWFAKFEALKELKRTDQANQCLEKAMSLNPEHGMELALGVAELCRPLICMPTIQDHAKMLFFGLRAEVTSKTATKLLTP
jgi:tetratricopeptide (TPR) repeat protein